MKSYLRKQIDIPAYTERSKNEPCFICRIISGEQIERWPVIYQNDIATVFFSKQQLLYGYTLVAPRKHREHVTQDFTQDEYLALQQLIYRVADALQKEVVTERLYILSLGSQQGNRHAHWHLVPLPPGVPYEEQQLAALNLEKGGLQIPDEEMISLAKRLRQRIQQS